MKQFAHLVNANGRFAWRGRFVDTAFLVEVGDVSWLVKIAVRLLRLTAAARP